MFLIEKFCGEGIPDWLTPESLVPFPLPVTESPYDLDSNGYPNLTECLQYTFADYYFSYQVENAFQCLYDNTNGLQDQFVKFWNLVSETFNNTEGVLGYELINEPWPGNGFLDPDLLLPGIADKVNLEPMYDRLQATIRANDNNHIIFYEHSLVDPGFSGFSHGPGGPTYNDRSVLSYHIYCGPTDREGDPSNIWECDLEDGYFYETSMEDVVRLGGGGFMTEFGAMTNASVAIESIEFLATLADNYLQSWCYWQFKFYQDITTAGNGESFYINGQLEEVKVKALSRTYAQAIAGVPSAMSFDMSTSAFELSFTLNLSITSPTIIYLNQVWYYPKGFTINVSPNVLTWNQSEVNYLEFTPISSAKDGQVITIKIASK